MLTCTDLRDRRNWRVVLEESRNLIQNINGHLGTKKTQIHTGAIEDYSLVSTRKKLALVRGVTRGTVHHRRDSLVQNKSSWGGYLINLWKF
jgi:hypothetical protein